MQAIDAMRAMHDALFVITRDPKIRSWIENNDPQALRQALLAIQTFEDWRDCKDLD